MGHYAIVTVRCGARDLPSPSSTIGEMPATHPTIRAVLFDYGQVLSGPPNRAALGQMLAITGLDEDVFQRAYWAHRHDYDRATLMADSYWRMIADETGFALDAAKLAALRAADVRMWTDLNLPMIEWAGRLAKAGYRIGILSNIGDGMSPWMVEHFDWLRNFHHLTWSWELQMAKPERAIYLHAAQALGCDPGEVLFIDDKEENIAAARDAGMSAVLYAGNGETPEGKAAHGNFLREMEIHGFGILLTAAPASI